MNCGMVNQHRRTVNIHTGRKLQGKSRIEILNEVLKNFRPAVVVAVQQFPDLIRITFDSEDSALDALVQAGVRLFGLWCRLSGGPPATIVHLFDYPFEEDAESVQAFFETYGRVRNVRHQSYLSRDDISTGTRLIDVVLERAPPRIVSINTYICRVWYKGQPLVCNLCGVEGHRASDCPEKNKCRRCGDTGHQARQCTNAWGVVGRGDNPPPAEGSSAQNPAQAGPFHAGETVSSPAVPVESSVSADVAPPAVSTVGVLDDGVLTLAGSAESLPSCDASADGADESDTDIGQFSSCSSPPCSASISLFSEESQSILPVLVDSNRDVSINDINKCCAASAAEINSKSCESNNCNLNEIDNENSNDVEIVNSCVDPLSNSPDECEMDLSGGSRKRKSSEVSDPPDPGFAVPRPSRSVSRSKACRSSSLGSHRGLPAVVSDRPKKV